MAVATSSWIADKPHSDRTRWISIYPAYVNSKKTVQEGRIVPKDQAIDNPTYQEIRDVLSAAGMKVGVENKLYPREQSKEMLCRGKVKVQLKDDNGDPLNPDFPNRKAVMLYICSMIPKLKSRQGKPVVEQSGQSKTAQPSTSTKKKGKGRR